MRKPVFDAHGREYKPRATYKSAGFTRETHNLPSICRAPEEETGSNDLSVLRARCRYIVQNYPQAAGFADQITRRVSTQIRIQSRMVDDNGVPMRDANEETEKWLGRAWSANRMKPWTGFTADGLSFVQAARLAMFTRVVDGEVFLVKSINRDDRRAISREWQVVSADNIADAPFAKTKPMRGNKVVQGVEVNRAGRPVAYHFYSDGKTRNYYGVNRKTKRVTAERVLHWYKQDRPGQVRGVSELARVILAFADIEEFSKAKIQAEWIANSFAALVHAQDIENAPIGFDAEETTSTGTTFLGDISPGIIQTIGLGVALDYMMGLGMEAIAAHEAGLRDYAMSRFAGLNWMQVQGHAPGKAAIFSFTLDGAAHAHDISTILDKKGVAVRAGHHCAGPLMDHLGVTATCRASFGMYNTKAEIDVLIEALELAHDLFG